jgi:hypothetical protein
MAIVLAEIRNRLVIGNEPTRKPHHLNVAPAVTFESTARLNPVEVAVDIEPCVPIAVYAYNDKIAFWIEREFNEDETARADPPSCRCDRDRSGLSRRTSSVLSPTEEEARGCARRAGLPRPGGGSFESHPLHVQVLSNFVVGRLRAVTLEPRWAGKRQSHLASSLRVR